MNKKNKIVLVTGGFDPMHSGHIALLKESSKLGNKLIVGLNSDEWLIRKKGLFFLPFEERKIIVENLKMVNKIISWNDIDNSAIEAIKLVLSELDEKEILLFANGGDRNISNIPEITYFKNNKKIQFRFGVGGSNKQNSSTSILEKYKKKLNL